MGTTDHIDAVIEMAIAYKAKGWKAFTPVPKSAGVRARAAVVIIGNPQVGWTRLVSIFGDGRFERAQDLVNRYNAAPDAALPAGIEAEFSVTYSPKPINKGRD